MPKAKQISKPLETREVTPEDFRELTGEESKALRDLIALHMRHGVPQGQTFRVDFDLSDETAFAVKINDFDESGARYRQCVLIFGWRPRFTADVSTFAEIAEQIYHGRYAAHDAEELLGELQAEITKADRIKLANKLNREEHLQDLIVERIQRIIGNPQNWRNPPPASTVFVLGPLACEKVS